jgi:hypothetical protein
MTHLSSLFCTIIGNFLYVLLAIGLLVWLAVPGPAIGIINVMFALAFIPRLCSNYQLYQTTKNLLFSGNQPDQGSSKPGSNEAVPMQQGESEGICLVFDRKRLARPTDVFWRVKFFVEVGLPFLWPLSALFRVGN